jgi:hypothetical protein
MEAPGDGDSDDEGWDDGEGMSALIDRIKSVKGSFEKFNKQ